LKNTFIEFLLCNELSVNGFILKYNQCIQNSALSFYISSNGFETAYELYKEEASAAPVFSTQCPGGGGYNWATLLLDEINTGTPASRLGESKK
jgi:hypothetical protein